MRINIKRKMMFRSFMMMVALVGVLSAGHATHKHSGPVGMIRAALLESVTLTDAQVPEMKKAFEAYNAELKAIKKEHGFKPLMALSESGFDAEAFEKACGAKTHAKVLAKKALFSTVDNILNEKQKRYYARALKRQVQAKMLAH